MSLEQYRRLVRKALREMPRYRESNDAYELSDNRRQNPICSFYTSANDDIVNNRLGLLKNCKQECRAGRSAAHTLNANRLPEFSAARIAFICMLISYLPPAGRSLLKTGEPER
jgi:hypothetical protein